MINVRQKKDLPENKELLEATEKKEGRDYKRQCFTGTIWFYLSFSWGNQSSFALLKAAHLFAKTTGV